MKFKQGFRGHRGYYKEEDLPNKLQRRAKEMCPWLV